MKAKAIFFSALVLLLLSALLAVSVGPNSRPAAAASSESTSAAGKLQELPAKAGVSGASGEGPSVAEQLQQEFAAVAVKVTPTVVNIDVARPVDMPQGYQFYEWGGPGAPNMPIPPELRDFFGFGFERPGQPKRRQFSPRQPDQEPPKTVGAGSGVVIDAKNGYILTNNHVVEKATEIGATLVDGKRHEAKLVGRDPMSDLAVIQIKADNLKQIEWGDSDSLEVGHWVLAFGQPDGLKYTVTKGIVSAKGRANLGLISESGGFAGYEDFIQTDAAVNPGNSGGPLTDIRGRLVGINSAIATHGLPQFGGISFAIPSNLARRISGQLIQYGEVVRGYLGVEIATLSDSQHFSEGYRKIAEKYGADAKGVFVSKVMPGTPADKAGVKAGDVIVKIGPTAVEDSKQLRFLVADMPVGSAVELALLRVTDDEVKEMTVEVTIAKQPKEVAAAAEEGGVVSTELGLTVQTLTPDVARDSGYGEDETGVIVTDVDPGSRADKAGIRPGDVISQIKYKGKEASVESAEDFTEAVGGVPGGDSFSVLCKRQGQSKYVSVK